MQNVINVIVEITFWFHKAGFFMRRYHIKNHTGRQNTTIIIKENQEENAISSVFFYGKY
jgi:hypothetical protein